MKDFCSDKCEETGEGCTCPVEEGGSKSASVTGYVALVKKWKSQADTSTDEKEQMWLYACAEDLKAEIEKAT